MRHLLRLGLIATLLTMSSCAGNKVKNFVQDFATAVAGGDSTAIVQMYPDSKAANVLKMDADAEQMTVEEKEDTFVVRLSGDKSLLIKKTSEGDLRIVDSHGILVFPDKRMDFALKTGWVKEGMSDLTMAQQFSDTTFINYLAKKYVAQIKSNLAQVDYIYGSQDLAAPELTVTGAVIIVNKNDFEIKGEDYKVCAGQDTGLPNQPPKPGKDIKPGQKQKFAVTHYISDSAWPTGYVSFVIPDVELLTKYYIPKGGEYEDFLHSPLSGK